MWLLAQQVATDQRQLFSLQVPYFLYVHGADQAAGTFTRLARNDRSIKTALGAGGMQGSTNAGTFTLLHFPVACRRRRRCCRCRLHVIVVVVAACYAA